MSPPRQERPADDDVAMIGRLLAGKWRVQRLLGAGGMSRVYAAVHRNGKPVAIKVLNRDLVGNHKVRARFMREGYIANRIGHEGAVAILDDGVDDEVVFQVMELLEGETLGARARRLGGRMPAPEVAFAAERLLEVLRAAHNQAIVHRDVKPENVFLTRAGQIKLLDFGIASLRELSVALGVTQNGDPLGTPGFIAPEQARSRWDEVDARTDLWAVGATMFRLLAGRCAHTAETANEVVIAAATTPAPKLASLCPDLAPGLCDVVDVAMAFHPSSRWASADAMIAALASVRATVPGLAWEPLVPEPARGGAVDAAGTEATAADHGAGALSWTRPGVEPRTTHVRGRRWLRPVVIAGVIASAAVVVSARRVLRSAVDGPVQRASGPAVVPPASAGEDSPAGGGLIEGAPNRPVAAGPPAPDLPGTPPALVKASRPRRPFGPRPMNEQAFVRAPVDPGTAATPSPTAPSPAVPSEGVDAGVLVQPLTGPSAPVASNPNPKPERSAPPGDEQPRPSSALADTSRSSSANSLSPVVSRRRLGHKIPLPSLPRIHRARTLADLRRVFAAVRDELVARADVSPEFASDVLRALEPVFPADGADVHPVALYYFVISEAALAHDAATAGRNLLAAHGTAAFRRLSDLPARERSF